PSPSSPERRVPARPGSTIAAPRACGVALAIEPRLKEPRRRRSLSKDTKRETQAVHMPLSTVKTASVLAWASRAFATASGRIRSSGLSSAPRNLRKTPAFGGSVRCCWEVHHFAYALRSEEHTSEL